jgi:hypothetical protein
MMAIACAAAVAAGTAPAARAQAAPDSAALASAVASVLADSVLPRLAGGKPIVVGPGFTAFDSAVARVLVNVPGTKAPPAVPGAMYSVETRGFTLRGDTAAVLVVTGEWDNPPAKPRIFAYVQEHRYLFVRGPGGWRFAGREFVRGSDVGTVVR